MMTEKLYLCTICRERFPQSEIRFDGQGMELVCHDCFSKKHVARRTLDEKSVIEERRSIHRMQEDAVTYSCTSCFHTFNRKKEFFVSKCPQCSSEKIQEERADTAQDILDNLNNEKNPY